MKSNIYFKLIIGVSIAIPLVVAILLYTPLNLGIESDWIKLLPSLNALLNSSTALLLVLALFAVKRGNIVLHSRLMLAGLTLGSLFLVSYVLYHANSTSVIFGDVDHDGLLSEIERAEVGGMRTIYVFTLLSHIGLSIIVVPFVLLAFYYALMDKVDLHKKIVKFTFPIWLYVSVTGVIVYLMISPYYL